MQTLNKFKMKKTAILSLLFLTAVMSLSAQENSGQNHRGPKEGRFSQKEVLTPEKQAAIQTKRMELALDLDNKQQNAVEKLFLKEANERNAQRDSRLKENKKSQMTTGYEKNMAQLDKKIAHKRAMKSILTTTQYEKWESSLTKKEAKMKRRRMKRPNKKR
jgi:protein CpxP